MHLPFTVSVDELLDPLGTDMIGTLTASSHDKGVPNDNRPIMEGGPGSN